MRPSELFGVAVRLVGLLLILAAILQFFAGLVDLALGGPGGLLAAAAFIGLPALVLGVVLIGCAAAIVRVVYPDSK